MIHVNLDQKVNEMTSNQVIIKFNPQTDRETITKLHNRMKAVVVEENKFLGFQVVTSSKPVSELLKYYKSLKETEYVKSNYTVHIA